MSRKYENDTLYRLWCVLALGAGHRLINELLGRCDDDPGKVYMALSQDEVLRAEMSDSIIASVDGVSVSDAESLIEKCGKHGIRIISSRDRDYPSRLAHVFAPPQILFVKGDISDLGTMSTLGVVGTRHPSEYSRQVTEAVVSSAVRNGLGILSGFADGIDICAALTAVRRHGKTYAVTGCGVDVDYPRCNSRYREMVAANGAIISEFPPGTEPLSWNFPQRNRILAGLSDTVAVIEAGEKSGSLNTASHAAEQGKTVFAVVPGDLFDKRYKGQAELIRDGAVPFMGMRDLIGVYETEPGLKEKFRPSGGEKSDEEHGEASGKKEKKSAGISRRIKAEKKNADREIHEGTAASDAVPETLPEPESEIGKAIVKAVAENGGLDLERLSGMLDCPTDDLLSELTMLELDNIIVNEGTRYVIGKSGRT